MASSNQRERSEAPLTISLIVNTTDRAGPLKTLLRSLEQQSYPHFEVIVVVGPTHDNTMELLEAYASRVRVLRCPSANLSQSRNIGLLAARGDIVAYIDDDAVPSRRWLEQLACLFANPRLDGTGGVAYLVHPFKPVTQFRLGIVSSLAEQVDIRDSRLEHLIPPGEGKQWFERMMGVNMAFRREALLGARGFDEFYIYIAEETDLALRLAQQGKTLHPVKEAPVYHIPASSRNRQIFSNKGKWWLQTRSLIYFCIKNGSMVGESRQRIILRCLHLVHGHWLWYGQLRAKGDLVPVAMWRMRLEELRAALDGALSGLFRPRRLISPVAVAAAAEREEAILPFLSQDSDTSPSVDPVSGRQAAIALSEPPLRICLLSQTYPPSHHDGVSRLTHLMAQGLFELGHTVHVITRGEQNRKSFYDGAMVHSLSPSVGRYQTLQSLPALYHTLNYSHDVHEQVRQLIFNDGVQILDSPLWQFEGLVSAMSDDLPVVVRLVTGTRQLSAIQKNPSLDMQLVGDMEQALLDRAAHLLPNTRSTLEAMQRHYRLPDQERYTIVPYGIIPAPDEAVRPFRVENPPEELKVLFVGRLEQRKGILDLFEAIPLILERVPGASFVIAGSDNSMHDGFQLKTGMDYPTYFAKRYSSLRHKVQFLGHVSDEVLVQLYQACDLFVAPSLYESFGLIYIEAMNYGKAVIGCRTGGIPEVVDHGVSGLLVEPGEPRGFADAAVSLLSSPMKLRDMGLAGRQQILDRFHYQHMARRYAEVYRSIIRRHEPGAR